VAGYLKARDEVLEGRKRDLGNLMRSKGYFWAATCPDEGLSWSHAGAVLSVQNEGPWFACIPKVLMPKVALDLPSV
jgi:G3E family GTPase